MPWPSRKPDRVEYEYAADDQKVSRYLQQSLQRIREDFVLPDGTLVRIGRQILPTWEMHVFIEGAIDVRLVRFGSEIGVPGEQNDDSHWVVHITPRTDKLEQDKMLKIPLIIQFSNHLELRIAGDD